MSSGRVIRALRAVARERGAALPVAMMVLGMVTLLVPPVIGTGLQTKDLANDSSNRKRALAAAEAGLQIAQYRLAMLKPSPAHCLTSLPLVPVNGECPAQTESLGNGASVTYHVTPALGAEGQCATTPAQPTGAEQRCITATGSVGDAVRRVQLRTAVMQNGSRQVFGEAGIIGLESVNLFNSVTSQGSVGSNGVIDLNNSITVNGSLLPSPTGTTRIGTSVTVTGGTQNTSTLWELPDADFSLSQVTNDNSLLSISHYSAGTREFDIPTGEYQFPGGTYNLCSLTAGNSVKLKVPSDQVVRIYIDSPLRPGSGCPSGSGRLVLNNSVELNKQADIAGNLEIYVYGTGIETANQPDIRLDNSVWLTGSVYAPRSTFDAVNSAIIRGGIATKVVRLGNSVTFTLTSDVQAKSLTVGAGETSRRAWAECSAQPSDPADPESGCD
jgi:Tfp pilus assembly protein PilX